MRQHVGGPPPYPPSTRDLCRIYYMLVCPTRSLRYSAQKKSEILAFQKCAGKNFPDLPTTGWRTRKRNGCNESSHTQIAMPVRGAVAAYTGVAEGTQAMPIAASPPPPHACLSPGNRYSHVSGKANANAGQMEE